MRISVLPFVLMLACLACGEHRPTVIQTQDTKANFGGTTKGGEPSLDFFFEEWLKTVQKTDPNHGKFGDAKRLLQEWKETVAHHERQNSPIYNEAIELKQRIENEEIKQEVTRLIDESQTRFRKQITPLKDGISSLEAKNARVRDLYIKLKIMKGLLMLEKKQTEELPQDKYSRDIEKKLEEALSEIKALMEK